VDVTTAEGGGDMSREGSRASVRQRPEREVELQMGGGGGVGEVRRQHQYG
jgi:hypothetical protein